MRHVHISRIENVGRSGVYKAPVPYRSEARDCRDDQKLSDPEIHCEQVDPKHYDNYLFTTLSIVHSVQYFIML